MKRETLPADEFSCQIKQEFMLKVFCENQSSNTQAEEFSSKIIDYIW